MPSIRICRVVPPMQSAESSDQKTTGQVPLTLVDSLRKTVSLASPLFRFLLGLLYMLTLSSRPRKETKPTIDHD